MTMSRITEALDLIHGLLADTESVLDADAPDGIARLRELVGTLSRIAGLEAPQPEYRQTHGTEGGGESSPPTGEPPFPESGDGLTSIKEAGDTADTDLETGDGRETATWDPVPGQEGDEGQGTLSVEGVDEFVEELVQEDVEVFEEEKAVEEELDALEEGDIEAGAKEGTPEAQGDWGRNEGGGYVSEDTGSEVPGGLDLMEGDEALEELEVVDDLTEPTDIEDQDPLSVEDGPEGDPDGTTVEGISGERSGDEGGGSLEELGLPLSQQELGEDWGTYRTDAERRDSKLLAEAFDGYLGAMDRYYNQYLLIPAGEYVTGARVPSAEDRPERKVALEPFYMGKFPVTNALFEIFVEKTGYRTTAERRGHAMVYEGRIRRTRDPDTGLERVLCRSALACRRVEGACWYQPSGPGSTLFKKRNHPVVQVSLEDALAFAAWTGKRLPSEDEWEAATRTTQGYAFPWGDAWKAGASNMEQNSAGDTSPVDAFDLSANAAGIMDTLGNVLEWTLTRACDPLASHRSKTLYLAKGGSWVSGKEVFLWSRFPLEMDAVSNILGFRCIAQ